MKKQQRSACTMPSSDCDTSGRDSSSAGSCTSEHQRRRSGIFWSQYEAADSDQDSSSLIGDPEGTCYGHANPDHAKYGSYPTHVNPSGDHWPQPEPADPLQFGLDGLGFPELEPSNTPINPLVLQCGIPTVTSYGAVSLLLRNLVRVDATCNGSVTLYNFPAASVTALSASGQKCYVSHPNGRVFHDGGETHLVTANSRYGRITPGGVLFSPIPRGLAYLTDDAGTRTTSAYFSDLTRDLAMAVFYDGNRLTHDRLQEESYRMAMDARYQAFPNGCEVWIVGQLRIKQDKYGEVTVRQTNDDRRTIMTSPTIRRVTVESPEVTINIDCYSRYYFTVMRDSSSVTSGYCGLVAKHQGQKAGIDRLGRLVLF